MKTPIFSLAALLLTGAKLHAQAPAHPLPACAEGGVARMAVTVPTGKTRDEVVQSLQQTLPAGTQIKILSDRERPALVNGRWFGDRMRMHNERFLRAGLQVNGAAETLLEVDAAGVVTAVHPTSGNRDLDRGLRQLWRSARYEPVVVGECRVPAWLHVSLEFASQYSDDYRDQSTGYRP